MPELNSVVLAMSDIEGKLIAARMLRKLGFEGYIVAHTMYADEAVKIREAGANDAYLTMSETGVAWQVTLWTNQEFRRRRCGTRCKHHCETADTPAGRCHGSGWMRWHSCRPW